MYIISAAVLDLNRNSIVKNSCLTLFGTFSLWKYLQWKVHYMLTKLPSSNILLNSEANVEMILNWTADQVKEISKPTVLKFKILRKIWFSMKVKNNPEYSTKIYLNRKRLSLFILNGEKIPSSSRKATFYLRDKNQVELTERRMKTTKQLLVQAQRFETDRPQQYWVEWQI